MRRLGMVLWGCLIVALMVGLTQGAEEKTAVPVIDIEGPTYDFGQITQGEVVKHDFRVLNRGSDTLEVKSVKPG